MNSLMSSVRTRHTARIALAASIALAFVATGCSSHSAVPAHTSAPVENVVDTVTVHPQPVTNQIVLNAHVMANPTRVVQVFSPASGRVLTLTVLPGEFVRKGQQLGTLQSGDAAQARSDYAKAKIETARADVQLARAHDLLAHQVMALNDYDNIKALDAADHADLKHARQALAILGLTPGSASDVIALRAPISGVVLSVGAAPGELQASLDSANPIATIADINPIWIVGDLYPSDLDSVHIGQPVAVSVAGYPGTTLHGTISNISDAVDPTTLTLKARVVLPNPGYKLKPGMYATITVMDHQSTAIVVPDTAVIRDGKGSAYVFVMNASKKPARRDVTLGTNNNGNYTILQGLNSGDRVVTTGAELLRETEDQ